MDKATATEANGKTNIQTKLVKLAAIREDERVRCRQVDKGHVEALRLAIEGGVELPNIEVAEDGTLLDGYHRLAALFLHHGNGNVVVEVNVRPVPELRERVLFAIDANAKHGRQLTNAEKRLLAIRLWETLAENDPERANKGLARRLVVSVNTIRAWRDAWEAMAGDQIDPPVGTEPEDTAPVSTPVRKPRFVPDPALAPKISDAFLRVRGQRLPVTVTEATGRIADRLVHQVTFKLAGPNLADIVLEFPDGRRSTLDGTVKFTGPGVIAVTATQTPIPADPVGNDDSEAKSAA